MVWSSRRIWCLMTCQAGWVHRDSNDSHGVEPAWWLHPNKMSKKNNEVQASAKQFNL